MATHFKNKLNCRGEGKLYLLFESNELCEFFCESKSQAGNTVPALRVDLSENEFVIVLADLAASQTLKFLTVEGECLFAKTIHPAQLALESKTNGVVRSADCARIRNIDCYGLGTLAPIVVTSLVPCSGGFIVRGRVVYRGGASGAQVAAYDERGALIGLNAPLVDESARNELDEEPFSIRIPSSVGGLCLSVLNGEKDQTGAFINIKPSECKKALQASLEKYADAAGQSGYMSWLSSHLLTGHEADAERMASFSVAPKFSVIVPLYKTPLGFFRDMADSVLAQTYGNWELVLVNSTPEIADLHDLVDEYAKNDTRVRYIDLEGNLGITGNTNEGIKVATGDYCCFFDHDDVLEPDILFEYAKAIDADPSINLLYCDEDKLYPDGTFANPTFKPDFSLDMARDNNYICHLLTVKSEALKMIEPSGPELDGAQDHAMVLKIEELGGPIHHVPKLLYHWRISETSTAANPDSKPYATIAGIKAVQQHLDRVGIRANVDSAHGRAFRYSPDYCVPEGAVCSVILATRGDSQLLYSLAASLKATEFDHIELVAACPSGAANDVESLFANERIACKVLPRDDGFNLSKWRNACAKVATGDVLVFVHDDVKPMSPNWLHVLSGFSLREDVGVVGTMTCDFDGLVQQAGLSYVGDKVISLSRGIHCDSPGYIFMPLTVRDVAAVSGVCHAMSKDAFERLGGYSEAYALDYADVDLCFKAAELGLKVIYTPEASLYHFAHTEAVLNERRRSQRHFEDKALLLTSWSKRFAEGDRWFSPQFSQDSRKAELYQYDVPCIGH